MSISPSPARRALAVASTATLALLVASLAPSAANAADADTGWLRLGHLSPNTKQVDVTVTPEDGGDPILQLERVGYGDVSAYSELAPGDYTVSMVPAGASPSTSPVVSSDVRVDADAATTVIAYGPTDELEVKAIQDDLTEPAAGTARIRLMQASTTADEVSVSTSTGLPIAQDARSGSVTAYAEVPAGEWTLELTGADVQGSTDVDVTAGSVVTLFVLDTAAGDLTILPVVDSAAVGSTPDGGVATGGGGTAPAAPGVTAPRGLAIAV